MFPLAAADWQSAGSESFDEPVDVIALDLGPRALAGTPSQLVENLARFLHIGLVGDLDVALIVGAVARALAARRLAMGGRGPHAARIAAIGVALALAHLVHLLGHRAGGLLKLVERVGLRSDCLAGRAAVERIDGIAHRALGTTEGLRDVAGAIAELAHHLAEHAAQSLLLPRCVAGLALFSLLALLALLSTLALARGAEALVEELLLALHHVLHLPHHLTALLIVALLLHVARPCRLQVFQHFLETRQHVTGGVLGPAARQLARPADHLLYIVP